MTEPAESVIVPYARFLEIQQRRQRVTTDLAPRDPEPSIDVAEEPPPADIAVARPLP